MVLLRTVKIFLGLCFLLIFWTLAADADIIYFKDGMKTICQEKAWEENGEIKCEYEGWIISYQKNEVQRIEKTTPEKQPDRQNNQNQVVQNKEKDKVSPKTSPSNPEGLAFYDPRRPYKYWTSTTAKHKSFKEAIDALAEKYARSSEWVQTHMGETNDLDQIHRNLANTDSIEPIAATETVKEMSAGIEFYNPRRMYPYWISETLKYKTFKEAIAALAEKYNSSTEWVQEHMGTTNDLNEIHRNLTTQNSAESSR